MRVGLAGLGFMGAMHLTAWRSVEGAEIGAVMSSDAGKLQGDLSSVGGNLAGVASRVNLDSATKYTRFEDLLTDSSLDAIDICLPTHLHADAAIDALRAGKHVFLEKPLALNSAEAKRVLHAQEASGRTLMVGHVLRFFPEYQALARLLPDLSPVRSAFFRRRCAAPAWSGWLNDPAKSGGAVLDLLVHDIDYCVSLWGMPRAVSATGHTDLRRGIDVCNIQLHYEFPGAVVVSGGWHHPKAFPFSMEFTLVTDEATIDWRFGGEVKKYSDAGEEVPVILEKVDPFAAELRYFVDCILRQTVLTRCPPVESAQAVYLVEQVERSRNLGGKDILCDS